jgi:glutamate-1-semialdehyde 2,1-aminomutase
MSSSTVRTTPPAPNHGSVLDRARAVTASDAWDLHQRFPIVMERACGVHAWDDHGTRYVDFTSCSGAAPLGVGYLPVLEAAGAAMRYTGGILPGPMSRLRVELAERLIEIFPCAERAVFFRTGSCATTAAVRLARVHTGGRLVLTSGYHGWHDWQLQSRPPLGLPDRDPDTIDFGYDLAVLSDLAARRRDLAAVIVTPEVNFFPEPYLHELVAIARRYRALVILDEVMTGFRYAPGGYHAAANIDTDLITVSKGLANGFALSAVLGRREVMKADEATYLGNTYQREVTPFAAALATQDAWDDGYARSRILSVGTRIMDRLNDAFARAGVDAVALSCPSMFDVVFADRTEGTTFFQEMWRRGFLMQYGGRFMPSAATADEDIDAMAAAAQDALRMPRRRPVDERRSADERLRASAVRFAEDNFAATPATTQRWFRLER